MAELPVFVACSITVGWRMFGVVSVSMFSRLIAMAIEGGDVVDDGISHNELAVIDLMLPCIVAVTVVLVLLAPLLVAGPSVGVTTIGSNNIDVTTVLMRGVVVSKDLQVGVVLLVDDLDLAGCVIGAAMGDDWHTACGAECMGGCSPKILVHIVYGQQVRCNG